MAAADLEVATYLQAQSYGTLGADLFAGELPAGKSTGTVVTGYPGLPDEHVCGTLGATLEIGRLQVRVQHTNEDTAYTNARDAATILGKVASTTLSGVRYRSITVLQSPGLLYRDGNQRPNVGFNVEFEREL